MFEATTLVTAVPLRLGATTSRSSASTSVTDSLKVSRNRTTLALVGSRSNFVHETTWGPVVSISHVSETAPTVALPAKSAIPTPCAVRMYVPVSEVKSLKPLMR